MFVRPSRLKDLPGIGVDRLGNAADALADPGILRLENLDTDLRPWHGALAETRRAVDEDAANSYLPFLGLDRLRQAATAHVARQSGVDYDWRRACVISAGGLSGILNVLLATLEPGDEVVLTDPIYAGLLNRVRLAGGVPRLARLVPGAGGWRLDLDAFKAAVAGPRVKAVLMMSPSMPTGCVLDAGEWSAVAEACAGAGPADDLRCRHGADPVRWPQGHPPRRPARHGRAHRDRRRRLQGTAHDRLAGGLGGGAGGPHGRRGPGGHGQRGLPGGHRHGRRGRRAGGHPRRTWRAPPRNGSAGATCSWRNCPGSA